MHRRTFQTFLAASVFVAAAAAQETPSEAPSSPESQQLVYTGQPLVVPLECRYEHLMRAGLVCNEDSPCELFLELAGVAAADGKVFVIGNVHSRAATVSSILLASEDQGVTWQEPEERIPAASLESIQFAGDEHGWIGGQQWDVDTMALPFFLITVDGGKRWFRRDLWDEDQDRSGAILEFHFESPQHGFLLIDRLTSEGDPYELYESLNGGRSWHIRQISTEKPPVRRGPVAPAAPDWRLREDREAAAFEVERQVSGSWTVVARFFSRVGSCAAMQQERELTEAAEPEEEEPEETQEAEDSAVESDSGVLVIQQR